MFNFGKTKKKETAPKEIARRVKVLEEELAKATQEIENLQKSLEKAVSKVGVTRYNPFGEIGGDQSFSIALLDNEDSGVVVTSHYGKEVQRVYAKPVNKGVSLYSLSEEEKDAIKKAKG